MLDTGSSLTTLPIDTLVSIASGLGIKMEEVSKGVPCSLGDSDLSFTFGFNNDGNATITVPMHNFLAPLKNAASASVTDQNGNP